MELLIHEDKTFDKVVYAGQLISGWEFQSCEFKNCDFTNSAFVNNKFLECTFEGCNLSMMKLGKSTLSDARFRNCKILGVNFSECQDFLFTVTFDGCILDYSSFMAKKMPKTRFNKSTLKEVTFSLANLSGSVFEQCNLSETVFNRTDLSAVDFSTSYNFSIDPELNILKKAIFSAQGLPGLLDKYGIRIV